MRDAVGYGVLSRQSVTDIALYASRWTAAKAGAAVSLWTAMPRRLNRYLEEMVSAQAHAVRLEDLLAWWNEAGDHHFTTGGKLIK